MKKRSREPKPLLPALAAATGPTLIKHLASCSTAVRSQSLRLIQSWLAAESQQLSDSDIKKLWKGLFYCIWHADKTPNQLALINRLITLFLSLQPAVSLEFFRGFLVTLRREWSGIDRLRLDKFYLLIRRFVKALFELMRLRKWDAAVLGEYFGVLEKDALLADDKLQGNGVNYHVASVFLEELAAVGFPVQQEVVDVILGPFFTVMKKGTDKILLGKVKSNVFDELVKAGTEVLSKKKLGEDCDLSNGNALLGVVALKMRLSGRLYEVTSSTDCILGNRKIVLALHDQFLKLEKELESSGIEIGIPEYNSDARNGGGGDDDEDVPQLIPIDFDASKDNVDGGTREGAEDVFREDKKSKKSKKGKDGDDKKKKKKKKNKKRKEEENKLLEPSSMVNGGEENEDLISTVDSENMLLNSGSEDLLSDSMENELTETVILNLQKQFEKVAAEIDSESDDDSDSSAAPIVAKKQNKRAKRAKRAKMGDDQELVFTNPNGTAVSGDDAGGKSEEKSAKKVRFSMKNNLIWKPQNPLPPESLRLPPSVTPRGSALKKGVPPGPVVEMPPAKKRVKQKKKAQNRLRPSTMIKRRKKVQTRTM